MVRILVKQRAVQEAVEIAQDVARRLLESYREHDDPVPAALRRVGDTIDLDVPITA